MLQLGVRLISYFGVTIKKIMRNMNSLAIIGTPKLLYSGNDHIDFGGAGMSI